ncbi:hypothetical protein FH972_008178 [Carpinus fangiana]|uniref:DUF7610 domain-containing protein n=1 Tax=Carpinus fangiana TaxID=176857 RepID=A0A5N6R0N0_9ROSI|nr:hypothetical protein FH972_008178 [Carpinus fangiana]
MTKRYSILQRKLQGLESELSQRFSLPATTACSQLLLEDIEQRFVFLNNLLSAEVASHPSKPHHLHHIEQRLAQLEHDFRTWRSFKTSLLNHEDDGNGSRCSCTESCLNDDGEASAEEDTERFSHGLVVGDRALVEFSRGLNKEKALLQAGCFDSLVEEKAEQERKGEQRRPVGVGSWCGAMAVGVVLGMALMGFVMVRFSGCFHYADPRSFLTST